MLQHLAEDYHSSLAEKTSRSQQFEPQNPTSSPHMMVFERWEILGSGRILFFALVCTNLRSFCRFLRSNLHQGFAPFFFKQDWNIHPHKMHLKHRTCSILFCSNPTQTPISRSLLKASPRAHVVHHHSWAVYSLLINSQTPIDIMQWGSNNIK